VVHQTAQTQLLSNLRKKTIAHKGQNVLLIDTLSIVPNSLVIQNIPKNHTMDYKTYNR
jgi:hypothetical protein